MGHLYPTRGGVLRPGLANLILQYEEYTEASQKKDFQMLETIERGLKHCLLASKVSKHWNHYT